MPQSYRSMAKLDYTNASLTVWGIIDGKIPSSGFWNATETQDINILELNAIENGIHSHCSRKCPRHVRVVWDNTTAINYINKWY